MLILFLRQRGSLLLSSVNKIYKEWGKSDGRGTRHGNGNVGDFHPGSFSDRKTLPTQHAPACPSLIFFKINL